MDKRFIVFLAFFSLILGFIFRHGEIYLSAVEARNNSLIRLASVSNSFIYAPPFVENGDIELIFVGDIMLDRGVANVVGKNGGDYKFPFLYVADELKSADITFGNLEGSISNEGVNQGSEYSFRFKPESIDGLKFAGFDILSIANNHIWDWGINALQDTSELLSSASIETVGAGSDYNSANLPTILEVDNYKIAFLAYTTLMPATLNANSQRGGLSEFKIEKAKEDVRLAKNNSNFVIVSLHWGNEYENQANAVQKKIARELIDGGADIIVGHHPHVVQELENYKDGWIAYSLGNFVFDQNFSSETMRGALLRINIEKQAISDVNLEKIEINEYFQPTRIESIIN